MATEVIEEGETLQQAQAAGKIATDIVPAHELDPGALNSSEELGPVALTRIDPGEQLTEENFGSKSQ